jgi:putative ATP-dependent endonuclease of the OLD family
MAKIINLNIKNYRGIKDLSLRFKRDDSLICLIGRGDSGKTTILDAISSVLSPNWNLSFSDTDFYNCDHTEKIEIVASVIDFPEKLLSDRKHGLNVRALNLRNDEIIDNVTLEDMTENIIPVLTIKLIVDTSLEPQWMVSNMRGQEDKPISAADRSLLNCFLISDSIDRHFSWNKGNPLYSLLKYRTPDEDISTNIVIEHLRKAKEEIDKNNFENLSAVTDLIKKQAAELGTDISKSNTTLDARELLIKDGKISLHEDSVPFRLKGKGSKRLASIAIQSVLVREGGIMLIDEIEQGLEPDRIKQAVRSFGGHHAGQIFITTHSRDAITELGSEPLLFMLKDNYTNKLETRSFSVDNEDLQKAVRACPEAFFSKKVIICEGATEVGICRAMDKWRRSINKPQMSFKDCAYIDGTGNTIVQRVDEINRAGLNTALFCDSDLEEINKKKDVWKAEGVSIFDCDEGLCLEQQVFKDMSWQGIKELLQYAENENTDSFSAIFKNYKETPINEWNDDIELRNKIIAIFKPTKKGTTKRDWFKKIHHGEFLGKVIFQHFEELNEKSRLRKSLNDLSGWIDKENC